MNIEDIQEALRNGRFQFTLHSTRKLQDDQITDDGVNSSVLSGEIIEDYPDDRPYPSCLIYGRIAGGEPLHSVWGYNEDERLAVLITVYHPAPGRWIDFRIRRSRNYDSG